MPTLSAAALVLAPAAAAATRATLATASCARRLTSVLMQLMIAASLLTACTWVTMLFGAGAGVGVLLGEMTFWDGEEGSVMSNERYKEDPPDGDKIERISVLPILDINLGLRFNIADRFVMRFEAPRDPQLKERFEQDEA